MKKENLTLQFIYEIFQLEFSVRANQHPKSLDSRLLFRNFRAAAGCSQCFASSATLIMTAMSSTSAVLNNKSNQNQDSFIKTPSGTARFLILSHSLHFVSICPETHIHLLRKRSLKISNLENNELT